MAPVVTRSTGRPSVSSRSSLRSMNGSNRAVELDQDVEIAAGTQRTTHRRAEKGQGPDAEPRQLRTKLRDTLVYLLL